MLFNLICLVPLENNTDFGRVTNMDYIEATEITKTSDKNMSMLNPEPTDYSHVLQVPIKSRPLTSPIVIVLNGINCTLSH